MKAAKLREATYRARARLQQAGIANAGFEARLLVQWATGTSPLDSITTPEQIISPAAVNRLEDALRRRIAGEPVHRIFGERAFYGLDFTLSADTLEPRPDTETVVDLALPFLQNLAQTKQPVTCLDMGTGSGAIAIALLAHVPQLHATGVDIAEGALVTAQANAVRAGVQTRFSICHSDWFTAVTGQYDLVISNPPYIPQAEVKKLDISVRNHDPLRALDGGIDGLDFYRALATGARPYLVAGGRLVVEIGINQKQDVEAIFACHNFQLMQTRTDLADIDRALMFKPA